MKSKMQTDTQLLKQTINISKKCQSIDTAFNVGAIIVTKNGSIFEGYSRETGDKNHAEEEAIYKALVDDENLEGATLYSSLEPCSERSSKAISCSELIIQHKFQKVVFAKYEGTEFVEDCIGAENIQSVGIEVIYLPL